MESQRRSQRAQVAQALARHSTITLTMDRYAHVALADTSKALASLPALPVAAAQHAAKGTTRQAPNEIRSVEKPSTIRL